MNHLPAPLRLRLAIDSGNPGVAVAYGLVTDLYQVAPDELLRYLVTHGLVNELRRFDDVIPTHPELMDLATTTGQLTVIQHLVGLGVQPTHSMLIRAIKSRQLTAVRYLVEQGAPIDQYAVNTAALKGGLELVRYFAGLGLRPSRGLLNMIAWLGDPEVVRYYLEELGAVPTRETLVDAVRSGNLGLVQYLIDHPTYPQVPTGLMVAIASERGNLTLADYLAHRMADQGGSV